VGWRVGSLRPDAPGKPPLDNQGRRPFATARKLLHDIADGKMGGFPRQLSRNIFQAAADAQADLCSQWA
jgi:hypothetical protein